MSKAVLIDFLAAGVTSKAGDSCTLTELWTNQTIGTFTSKYYVTGVQPHDHVAMKVVCSTT